MKLIKLCLIVNILLISGMLKSQERVTADYINAKVSLQVGDSSATEIYSGTLVNDEYVLAAIAAGVVTLSELDSLTFSTTTIVNEYDTAKLYWDDENFTLSLQTGLSNSTLQIGQELFVLVQNNSGSTIQNGSACYIYDAGGRIPRIRLAEADNANTAYKFIGVTTSSIAHGDQGFVTTYGQVHDVNTVGYLEGAPIYLSNTAGQWTQIEPTRHKIRVGYCVYAHAVHGIICVKPENLTAYGTWNILNTAGNAGTYIDTALVQSNEGDFDSITLAGSTIDSWSDIEGGGGSSDSNFVSLKAGSITIGDTLTGDTIRIDTIIRIYNSEETIETLIGNNANGVIYSQSSIPFATITTIDAPALTILTTDHYGVNISQTGDNWYGLLVTSNGQSSPSLIVNSNVEDTLAIIGKVIIDTSGKITTPLDTLGASEYDPAAVAAAATKYIEVRAGASATSERAWLPYTTGGNNIYVTPEDFGAVGDSVTDDLVALNAMFDYARTNNKDVVFNGTTHKISGTLNVSNTNIYGRATIEGTNKNTILNANGSIGTYYNIASSVSRGERFISISNTTFLNSLSLGSLVKIISDSIVGDNCRLGEIHKVDSIISTGIYIADVIFSTYLTTHTARVAKITPTRFNIDGDFLLKYPFHLQDNSNDNNKSMGIYVSYSENSKIIGVNTFQCAGTGVMVSNCYKPIIRVNTDVGYMQSYGYGVSIISATMYADVSGTFIGNKHCVETGGELAGGIPWEVSVHNSRGVVKYYTGGATFDSHPSTGSIYFSNCRSYGNGGSGSNGFNLDAIYATAENCYTYNTYFTYTRASNYKTGNVTIQNCHANNYYYGVAGLSGSNFGDLVVDGFYGTNGKDNAYGFYLTSDTIKSININNINLSCETGFFTSSKILSDVINISNAKFHNDLTTYTSDGFSISSNIDLLNLNNIYLKKYRYGISLNSEVRNVISDGLVIDSLMGNRMVYSADTIEGMAKFYNTTLRSANAATTTLFNLVHGVNRLDISNLYTPVTNVSYVTNMSAGRIFNEYFRSGFTGSFVTENATVAPIVYRNFDADAVPLNIVGDSIFINTKYDYNYIYSGSIDALGAAQDTCVIRMYVTSALSSSGAGNLAFGNYSLVVNRGNNVSLFAKQDVSFVAVAASYGGGNQTAVNRNQVTVNYPTIVAAPITDASNTYFELYWINAYAAYAVKPTFVFYALDNIKAIKIYKK